MRSNEELLREGECPRPNCIEPAGHTGQCSGDMVRRLPNLLAKVARLEAEAAPLRAEQVRPRGAKAFMEWAEANKSRIHTDALDEAAMGFSAGWAAALDTLKGVE